MYQLVRYSEVPLYMGSFTFTRVLLHNMADLREFLLRAYTIIPYSAYISRV